MRRRQQVTQQDLAQVLGISQSRVSQIERQSLDDTVLSTLAAYVEALGGRVRVIADFGDELVVLSRVIAGTLTESGVVPRGLGDGSRQEASPPAEPDRSDETTTADGPPATA